MSATSALIVCTDATIAAWAVSQRDRVASGRRKTGDEFKEVLSPAGREACGVVSSPLCHLFPTAEGDAIDSAPSTYSCNARQSEGKGGKGKSTPYSLQRDGRFRPACSPSSRSSGREAARRGVRMSTSSRQTPEHCRNFTSIYQHAAQEHDALAELHRQAASGTRRWMTASRRSKAKTDRRVAAANQTWASNIKVHGREVPSFGSRCFAEGKGLSGPAPSRYRGLCPLLGSSPAGY